MRNTAGDIDSRTLHFASCTKQKMMSIKLGQPMYQDLRFADPERENRRSYYKLRSLSSGA